MKTAAEFCTEAARLAAHDRNRQHGDLRDNHENIAAMWNGYLHDYLKPGVLLTGLDVANLMEALKIARRKAGQHNSEDFTDGAGYAAVAGEIAERLEAEKAKGGATTNPEETDVFFAGQRRPG